MLVGSLVLPGSASMGLRRLSKFQRRIGVMVDHGYVLEPSFR
jgi:hypothetical protein